MQTVHFPSLADQIAKLPADGAGRDRQLHRLVDRFAESEALLALQAAADLAKPGLVAELLLSSRAMLSESSEKADAVRSHLTALLRTPQFDALLSLWVRELREVASARPETGACTLASALELWSWTLEHFRTGEFSAAPFAASAIDELSEKLAPLVAARCLAIELVATRLADAELRSDLSRLQAARTAAATGATCAELVFGYRRHLVWDAEGCATCWSGEDLDELEALMPGIASGARMNADVLEADGSRPRKAGPCVRFDGVEAFTRLRSRLDGCLTGARIARDRAAAAIGSQAMLQGSAR